MREVKILSQYGGPIYVDQCQKCGGIWFDESDLFRANQGEAEKIEELNTEILRSPSAMENSTLFCPRDGGAMHRFTDRYFPQDIVLARCQLCHGVWLNRGMFTKYQQFRQKSMRPRRMTQYAEMETQPEESREDGLPAETRGRLVEFLAIPIEVAERYVYPFGFASVVKGIADFLATTITKLLFPGWEG
jgi:Zn-finger nucleic acid-binding protein